MKASISHQIISRPKYRHSFYTLALIYFEKFSTKKSHWIIVLLLIIKT